MKATKNTFLTILLFSLVTGWMYSVCILINESASTPIVIAVLAPTLLAATIIYMQHGLLPSKQLYDISKLATQIENHLTEKFDPIEVTDAPDEVVPLINAVNELLAYFEDRYNQERDFTANASHELRTPLAGIRLHAEIAEKTKTEEQRAKALRNIIKAVDRGTRLVEQLLTLSRLTADKTNLALEGLNLGRTAATTIAELTDFAETRHINLKMKDWDRCYIEASEASMGILINNLIRNAIIYCPQDSTVEVDIICNDRTVKLVVEDNGPGIPEEQRELVLNRFQKADRGSNIGTGLGLSIVKRIADLHDATLLLTSGKNDRGLKVIVSFNRYALVEM